MDDDRVVPIKTRLGKPPVALAPRGLDACKHLAMVVDEQSRVVDCDTCGARLDPIAAIAGLARRWDRWEREWRRLEDATREYARSERRKWELRRDRHLNAHRDHVLDPTKTGWQQGECRVCWRLVTDMPSDVRIELSAPKREDA